MSATQTGFDRFTGSGAGENDGSDESKYPMEVDGCTLHKLPYCPECGEMGSYQGAGSTSVSNWGGRAFSLYYCGPCDRRFKVHAKGNESPTM